MRLPAAALLLGLLLCALPARADLPESLARVRRSVVLLLVETPEGAGSGTGFAVARRGTTAILATNHHVAGDAVTILVRTHEGKTAQGRLLVTDEKADLALVEAPALDLAPLRLAAPEEVREGSEIGVLGYPLVDDFVEEGLGIQASLSRGVVGAVREREGVTLLQVDAGLNPGNSGGPAFDYKTGRVVGVAAAKHMGAEGIGLLVRVDALRALMQRQGISLEKARQPRVQPVSSRRLAGARATPAERVFPRWIVLALFLVGLLGVTGMAVAALRSQRGAEAEDDRPIL